MVAPNESPFAAALRRRDRGALDELLAAPLRPTVALVPRPWGGDAIARHVGLPPRAEPIGESFELAAAPSDPEAAAFASAVVLPDGGRIALVHLFAAFPEILGDEHVLAFGHALPLMPKLLDVQSLLSVQAHPAAHPELYVILDAMPGATMYLGLREDVDDAFAAALHRGAALQRGLGLEGALASDASQWLIGPRDAPLPAALTASAPALLELRALGSDVLAKMHTLALAPGMVVHNCVPHPADGRASSTLHALGNPERRPVLALEIRRAGPTYRAWDHGRLPARALDIEAALANVPLTAQDLAAFVVASDGVFAIDNGVFRAEGITVDAHGVSRCGHGCAELVHVARGAVELTGPRGTTVLRVGQSALVPATWGGWALRGDGQIVVASLVPGPTTLAARTRTIRRVRALVDADAGPRDVIAIANGGDARIVADTLAAHVQSLFRKDGATRITVHEEPVRRGQLLGMLDAVRGWSPRDPHGVALGIMLPGQGTRLSPVTQRLHGIKPLVPVPIRTASDAPWLSAGAASLHAWIGVTDALQRAGFSGIAWKWGDEPQLPTVTLDGLDLREVDAVRFGKRAAITDELATSKEWLLRSTDGRLAQQVRRRPADALRERLATAGPGVVPLVHLGSPALSHRFVAALATAFGDVAGWLDIDGYLFEALTHDPHAWQREIERDPGLQAVLAICPDFYARARSVADRIAADRGAPLAIAVVDCGTDTFWCDMGQLASARDAFAVLAAPGEHGEIARRLAWLDDVVPDRFGNLVVGSSIPTDGSITDSVVVDSTIVRGRMRGAIVIDSELGDATLGTGSVVLDSTIATLDAGTGAWVFRAIAEQARLAADHVLTTLAANPQSPEGSLEMWTFDVREDPTRPPSWAQRVASNPTSFADKAVQMRQREHPVAEVERVIEQHHRAPLRARILSTRA
jgi:hypothetical protein